MGIDGLAVATSVIGLAVVAGLGLAWLSVEVRALREVIRFSSSEPLGRDLTHGGHQVSQSTRRLVAAQMYPGVLIGEEQEIEAARFIERCRREGLRLIEEV